MIERQRCVSSGQHSDQLLHCRGALKASFALEEPARQGRGFSRLGEGILSIDEDGRRASHAEPDGLLTGADFLLADHGHHPGLLQGTIDVVAGQAAVRALRDIEQIDLHGGTVRVPAHWKVKRKAMRIGELAERSGVSTKTIRYYEDIGLVPPPPRSASGYRDYEPSTLERLIRSAQAVGLCLGEIRGIVGLRDQGETPCGHVLDLLRTRSAELDPADGDPRRICHLVGPG